MGTMPLPGWWQMSLPEPDVMLHPGAQTALALLRNGGAGRGWGLRRAGKAWLNFGGCRGDGKAPGQLWRCVFRDGNGDTPRPGMRGHRRSVGTGLGASLLPSPRAFPRRCHWCRVLGRRRGCDPSGFCPSRLPGVPAPRGLAGERCLDVCVLFPVVNANHSHKPAACGFGSSSFFPPPVPALRSRAPCPGCGGGALSFPLVLAKPGGVVGTAVSGLAALHPPRPHLGGGMGSSAGRQGWVKHGRCECEPPQVPAPGLWGPKGTAPARSSLSCSLGKSERFCNGFSIPLEMERGGGRWLAKEKSSSALMPRFPPTAEKTRVRINSVFLPSFRGKGVYLGCSWSCAVSGCGVLGWPNLVAVGSNGT